MNMTQKSYDRQDGETSKAYQAFTIYRNMGVSRSLDRTAVEFYPTPETPQKRPRNIAQIEVWSRTKNWVDRCKDFDRDEEAIFRDKIRQSSLEEHNRQLEQFRQHNEEIGFGLFKMGLRLLAIGEKIIQTFEDKEVLDSKDIDLFLAIPNSIKAIGALGASGSDLAADGLLIRQLMEKLKEAES
jgi:hypothetical protein